MYGNKFKKLRLDKGKTLKQTSEGVTTAASLSRWENNKETMDFEKVLRLLDNINCSAFDLLGSGNDPFFEQVNNAYANDKEADLKKLVHFSQEEFKNLTSEQNLSRVCVSCAFYLDLTGENLLPVKAKAMLIVKLQETDEWDLNSIILFGSSTIFLSNRQIFGISLMIVNNFDNLVKQGFKVSANALVTILNSSLDLLMRDDIDRATILLKKVDRLNLGENYCIFILRTNFYIKLINYRKSRIRTDLVRFYDALKTLGLTPLVKKFQHDEKEISERYIH